MSETIKIGTIFLEKKSGQGKDGKTYEYFTGATEDKSMNLVAYLNTSKTGSKYLSIYQRPKLEKKPETNQDINQQDLPF